MEMAVNVVVDVENEMVSVSANGSTIKLSATDMMNAWEQVHKEIFFREDVMYELAERFGEGDPKLQNEDYINRVLDRYAELRDDNDGNGWQDCLDEAIRYA